MSYREQVKIELGAYNLLSDRLIDEKEIDDIYEIVEEMRDYKVLHNMKNDKTYFIPNVFIKKI